MGTFELVASCPAPLTSCPSHLLPLHSTPLLSPLSSSSLTHSTLHLSHSLLNQGSGLWKWGISSINWKVFLKNKKLKNNLVRRLSKISVTFKTHNYDNSESCKKLIFKMIKLRYERDGFISHKHKKKPAAQAAGADPSRCSSTILFQTQFVVAFLT